MFIKCPQCAQKNSKMDVLERLLWRSIWSYAISTHMTRKSTKHLGRFNDGKKIAGLIEGYFFSKFIARNMSLAQNRHLASPALLNRGSVFSQSGSISGFHAALPSPTDRRAKGSSDDRETTAPPETVASSVTAWLCQVRHPDGSRWMMSKAQAATLPTRNLHKCVAGSHLQM